LALSFYQKMTTNKFSNIAYARLNLEYDRELFVKEYDELILPHGLEITNNLTSVGPTAALNKVWGMIPPELYNRGDIYMQQGDAESMQYFKRDHPGWSMVQLMACTEVANETVVDPLLVKFGIHGGPSFRNETLDLNFHCKEQFRDMQLWKWIQTLPFKKINSIHCVSIEPGGFSIIHRDMKGLYNSFPSGDGSRLFKKGFIVLVLNISDGGSPLYWSLDGKDAVNCYKANDAAYLSNDYFMHGVGICTSRRRQVRVAGIPTNELWNLIDKTNVVAIDDDYQFDAGYSREHAEKALLAKSRKKWYDQ